MRPRRCSSSAWATSAATRTQTPAVRCSIERSACATPGRKYRPAPVRPELSGGRRTPRPRGAKALFLSAAGNGRIIFRLKAADQAHQPTLNVDLVGPKDPRLVIGVGGLERDRGSLFAQTLEGCLLLLDQGHDNVAVVGGVAALDDDDVALVDAGLDHGIALHFQGEMLAARDQIGRHPNVLRMILNGAD